MYNIMRSPWKHWTLEDKVKRGKNRTWHWQLLGNVETCCMTISSSNSLPWWVHHELVVACSESFYLFFKAKHELDLDFFSFLNKLNPPSNVNDFSWSSLLCIIVFFTQGCEWIQSGMACLVKVCRFDFLRELEWKWVWAIGKVFENAL